VANLSANEKDRADYVLRVPADKLDALMDSAATLGTVQQRTVSAEDVTDRMVDAAARLTSLRASRDRLRQLLDRATNVTDVVMVERELARVQSELESLEARMQALEGQVALSELSVHLRRRIVPGPLAVVALGAGKVISKLFIWR
jgi:predicted  nucleic acid-binding Zn-ribbon protein